MSATERQDTSAAASAVERATDAAMHRARGYPSNGTERDHWRGVARAALDAAGVPALREALASLDAVMHHHADRADAAERESNRLAVLLHTSGGDLADAERRLADLRGRVEATVERYAQGDGDDIQPEDGWRLLRDLRADLDADS